MTINHYDCVYLDRKGNKRTWVTPAKSSQHVQQMFSELVGEGRIVSIKITNDWD